LRASEPEGDRPTTIATAKRGSSSIGRSRVRARGCEVSSTTRLSRSGDTGRRLIFPRDDCPLFLFLLPSLFLLSRGPFFLASVPLATPRIYSDNVCCLKIGTCEYIRAPRASSTRIASLPVRCPCTLHVTSCQGNMSYVLVWVSNRIL